MQKKGEEWKDKRKGEKREAREWISEHSRAHQDDISLSRTRSNFLSWLRG